MSRRRQTHRRKAAHKKKQKEEKKKQRRRSGAEVTEATPKGGVQRIREKREEAKRKR